MDTLWGPEGEDEEKYREEYNRKHYGPPDEEGRYKKGGPFNSGLFMFPLPVELGLLGVFVGVILRHQGIV